MKKYFAINVYFIKSILKRRTCLLVFEFLTGHIDIQDYETQHNGILHTNTQHKRVISVTQYKRNSAYMALRITTLCFEYRYD
jgi:hypothetical protein